MPNPPPDLPEPVGRVLVQVTGDGTVTARPSSSARLPAQASGPIRCGVRGLQCYSEVAPKERVTLTARPESGNTFSGWTNGCTGRQPQCTVTASAAKTVAAAFLSTRRERRAVRFSLISPRIRATWSRSDGRGTLVVRGSLSARASLNLQLRRPGGGPLFTRRYTVSGGAFQLQRTLRRGTLSGGAILLPGGFVLSIRGVSGRIPIPLQVRTLTLASPLEGVVRRATFSSSQNGTAQTRLPIGVREAWAIFQFETQPLLGPITATWYAPNGTLIGSSTKNNRPRITTGIGSAGGLAAGLFRVDLAAGGRIVKRLSVRVG